MALPVSPTADLKLVYTRDAVNRTYLVDLVLSPGGDLRLVAGLDRLEQDIRRWLQVALGHYVFDVTWGDPLWAERGRPRPANVADLVRAALKEAEDAFLRAQDQAAAEGYLSTDEQLDRFEDVQVITYNDDPGRVDVLFTMVARSGNNRPAELWVPAGPFPTGILAPKPPVLTITAVPGALGPDGVAALSVTYDGSDVVLLSITSGGGSLDLIIGGNPAPISFQGLGLLTTFPGTGGGSLTYTAPSTILAPGTAVITAEAVSGSLITALATVAIALVPAPALVMHFQDLVLLPGAQTQLLVTYSGHGVVTLSVSAGTLGEYAIVGTGHSQTTGITYTAPIGAPGEFLPGTGFGAGPGLALPLVVTASGSDGISTAMAATTIVAGLGGAMSGSAVGGAARLATTVDPGSVPAGGALSGTIVPQGGSWSGGAQYGALASQSWLGGAQYGSLTSQSWSGGASTVAGVPYWVAAQQGGAHPTSVFEFFFKVAGAPASDMTLVDFNAGVSGYVRVKLTSALHVYAELDLPNTNGVVVTSWDISTNAISTGVWYYVEVASNPINNFTWRYVGRVQGPGGVYVGAGDVYWPRNDVGNNEINSGSDINLSMTVGVGTSLSSGYLAFPDTAGWEMSKLWLHQAGPSGSLFGLPVSDRSGGDLYYSGRQSVGAAAQLTDGSGNARHATASPQGLTVNLDGPYA